MATITFSVAGKSASFTLSDADSQRILNAYLATYTVQPTLQQLVKDIGAQFVSELVAFAVNREKAAALAAAATTVSDIPTTPN